MTFIRETLKDLMEGANRIILHIGLIFVCLLAILSLAHLCGMELSDDLVNLNLTPFLRGALPYIWPGLLGLGLLSQLAWWWETIKKPHFRDIQIEAEAKNRMLRMWRAVRGYSE